MTQYWQPGTQYDYGTVVLFEGMLYRRSSRTRDYSPAQVSDTKLFSPIALRLVTYCRPILYN